MDARASLYLPLPFLIFLAILGSNFHLCDGDLRITCMLAGGAGAATLTFTNNCPYTVWPVTLTGGVGGQLSSTGFELATGTSYSINDVPDKWSGRVWGRTGCITDASGKFVCSTADCGSGHLGCNGAGSIPPASMAEFSLAAAGSGQRDFYDISLVDGFNLPLSLTPRNVRGCSTTSCAANVNSVCPSELAVQGTDGSIVACMSACVAFNQPQYCCTGAYGTPDTCQPTNYSKIFKNQCPQAYSYSYDNQSGTFTCAGGAGFLITFCP